MSQIYKNIQFQKFVMLWLSIFMLGMLAGCGGAKNNPEPEKTYEKWKAGTDFVAGEPNITDPNRILDLYQFMKDAHEILSKNNVQYWADWGTLIGALRHDGIIPWDDDLDIALFPGEEDKFLRTSDQFAAIGYHFKEVPLGHMIFNEGETLFIDVFSMKMGNGGKVYYKNWEQAHREKDPKLYYNLNEILPLKLHKFGEFQVNVPNDAFEEISWWAGEDWFELGVQTHNHVGKPNKKVKFKMSEPYNQPAQPTGPLKDRVGP